MRRKGQIGVEYLIIVGFLTFAIISLLALAYFYSEQTKDKIRLNQAESFATQLIGSAETVFFAGEPSKTTISLYLPSGVDEITISGNALLMRMHVSNGGENLRIFDSKVGLSGVISLSEGTKRLTLDARTNDVMISPAP